MKNEGVAVNSVASLDKTQEHPYREPHIRTDENRVSNRS